MLIVIMNVDIRYMVELIQFVIYLIKINDLILTVMRKAIISCTCQSFTCPFDWNDKYNENCEYYIYND